MSFENLKVFLSTLKISSKKTHIFFEIHNKNDEFYYEKKNSFLNGYVFFVFYPKFTIVIFLENMKKCVFFLMKFSMMTKKTFPIFETHEIYDTKMVKMTKK